MTTTAPPPATPKGEATRDAILAQATELASVEGLEGLSIGALATHAGMSKSGLFAHFGSKTALQLAVIEAVREEFVRQVIEPARKYAGERRLRALADNWCDWTSTRYRGGCPFIAAAAEFDDREGPVRDKIREILTLLHGYLAHAASKAVEAGEFRQDLDPDQFTHDFYAIVLGFNHSYRLMRDKRATRWAKAAIDRLMDDAHAA